MRSSTLSNRGRTPEQKITGETLNQLNDPNVALLSYDLFMGLYLHHSPLNNAKDVT
jgi:hypothetical protein